ncbi:SsgA family sporulation/cell division regulator [Streptomyces sp. TLI_105]|uniref:SsgA family sporulation/cell division regulator n=1 Tax=Streptomyces sp. TLI_105 TaxID=1881019 RepID=UPI0008953CF3|nr:SsgA family sporulation/cell division regulator [Streptomyces sp. TLI_105]SEE58498.1 Streptomyces sporulation and cell division protein, SsgA [Streptomyces sp. TLI_105]
MKKCHLSLESTLWVTTELPLDLTCEFSYDTSDPLAVTLVLDSEGERPVRWNFCRQLLADGLVARAGQGEVVLWPLPAADNEPASFCVQVGGRGRMALFEIPSEPVAQWLARTWAMVPSGTELDGVDWDELLQLAD